MTLSVQAAARDAWRRWTADRAIILAVAGPFLFLPVFGWLLLAQEPGKLEGATQEQKVATVMAWLGEQLPWLGLRLGFELFATVAILSLYLARDHRQVSGLLTRSLRQLPLFTVAVLSSWGLVTLGTMPGLMIAGASGGALVPLAPLLIAPACYIYGRVALTGPVLVAEPGVGFTGAIARSVALTHGNGWRVFGVLALPLLAGFLALQLIGGLDHALRTAGGDIHPAARAFVDGVAAVAATASGLARVLLQVSLYRRLATPRHGI